MALQLSSYRGCLLGMAVGDAMGYAVDSRSLQEIREDYGPDGLLGYDLVNGYADVTSYTQLAAFSANGLLMGLTRGQMQGKMAPLVRYIAVAIKEWSRSQHYCPPERNYCWLSGIPELKRRHCMDNRMLDLLAKGNFGTPEDPVSRYNQPGSLTVVIPIALMDLSLSPEERNRLGAEAIALTHGDPEAFLCGAVLVHALRELLEQPDHDPEALIQDTRDAITLQFGREYGQLSKIWELLQLAVILAHTQTASPADAMEQLGCRTCAEVLAGAAYACMTCHGDFDTAMITAVNHSGRSAAVGAVTGAILGVIMGESALPDFYVESLEPTPYLMELAEDLISGCPMDMGSNLFDDDWDRKYLHAGQ